MKLINYVAILPKTATTSPFPAVDRNRGNYWKPSGQNAGGGRMVTGQQLNLISTLIDSYCGAGWRVHVVKSAV